MRITDSILFRTTLSNVNAQRGRLARLQEQAASGLRINRPSDDPVGTRDALRLRSRLDATAQFDRNVTQARNRIVSLENAIADANDVLTRARELAVQGASATTGAEGRALLATEVERLHDRLLDDANTRAAGAYVFAGHLSAAAPFQVSGPFVDASPSPTVAFVGETSQVEVEIDEGERVPVTLDGQRVFLGDGDGDGNPDAGREDLFDVLADLRDALVADDADAVRATLDRLGTGQAQLARERTRVGAVDTELARKQELLSDREFELQRELSLAQDADTIEVLSSLVREETALQASLEATARILQPSLLDFLG